VVRVSGPPAVERRGSASFTHGTHPDITCVQCHTIPVTLAASTEARTCVACHDQHHDAGRACAACHAAGNPAAHARDTHESCTQCHAAATVVRLEPDRQFCLGCHAPETDHHQSRPCTACHLFATPEGFRPRLAQGT
jgi:hypothetical protein